MKIKILSFIFILFFCKQTELKITKLELCEYFNSKGECKKTLSESHTYQIKIDKKKILTWRDFSNHLYFHSRETPGFILHFNRDFSTDEKLELKNQFKSFYEFLGGNVKMEGIEIGENWIGSFQYLGSIIKESQKKTNSIDQKFLLNEIFPRNLKMKFNFKEFEGEINTKIDLNIID